MKTAEYVQYGCGFSAPASWRNFDASPTLRIQKAPLIGKIIGPRFKPIFPEDVEYGDVVKGLPVQPKSCKGIYCSHILEHLALEDMRTALRNTYSYLREGGTFRFVLPDLEYFIREYQKNENYDAASVFMRDTYLGLDQRDRSLMAPVRHLLGNSKHLWMWDYKNMAHELGNAGFRNIRRAYFGDSPDANFKDVEAEERWTHCLGVECVR